MLEAPMHMDGELETMVRRMAAAYYTMRKLLDPTIAIKEAYLAFLKDRVMSLRPPTGEIDLEKLLGFIETHGSPLPLRQLVGRQKKLLGFICGASPECEEFVKVMDTLASEYSGCSHVIIEDMSADSLAVKYIIEKHSLNQIIIYALKQRGRTPGLYIREFRALEVGGSDSLEKLGASLRGSLDIDVLLGGLAALGVQSAITVVECEPSEDKGFCSELIGRHAVLEVKSVCD